MGFFDDLSQRLFGGTQSGGGQQVDPSQQQFLDLLRRQASTTFNQQQQGAQQQGFASAGQLGGLGQGFLGQLGQAGQGIDSFQPGNELTGFSGQGFVDNQIESLTDVLNRNLSFNLQGINQQAAATNTFGGGRQGVAAGTAIGDTQLALGAGTSNILQQDLLRRQQAAGQQFQGGLFAGQSNQQAQIAGAGIGAQSALGGLGQLGGQFNLSQAGFNNAFQPLANFGNIIGQPTILGAGQGQNFGQGASNAIANNGQAIGSIIPF